MLSFLRSSCFEHSCDQNRERTGQLFGFLDNFLAGPQENPITLPTGSDGKGSFTLAMFADENAATRDKALQYGVIQVGRIWSLSNFGFDLMLVDKHQAYFSSFKSDHLKT
jgi:hypothetical protein